VPDDSLADREDNVDHPLTSLQKSIQQMTSEINRQVLAYKRELLPKTIAANVSTVRAAISTISVPTLNITRQFRFSFNADILRTARRSCPTPRGPYSDQAVLLEQAIVASRHDLNAAAQASPRRSSTRCFARRW
jgi:hypothetical protein